MWRILRVPALSGTTVTTLRRGDEQIPVVSRLRMEERANLSDIQNLYVYSSQSNNKVPLLEVSSDRELPADSCAFVIWNISAPSLCRALLQPGVLPSEVFSAAAPKLRELQNSLPPGYKIIVSGEQAKQEQGFKNLAIVMAISIALIFFALAFQFRHSIKPLLVLAAAPYGVVGALIALYVMSPVWLHGFSGNRQPGWRDRQSRDCALRFHRRDARKRRAPEQALLDAGIVRLRPVMITVGATILALFPLAIHGGPLWQPLCYAQIGGLGVATFITLLLVPVLYSIFVLDLKAVKWGESGHDEQLNPTLAPEGDVP